MIDLHGKTIDDIVRMADEFEEITEYFDELPEPWAVTMACALIERIAIKHGIDLMELYDRMQTAAREVNAEEPYELYWKGWKHG